MTLKKKAVLIFAAAGVLAGCAAMERSERQIHKQELGVLYYSDLGPQAVDVSSYPEEQKRNYAVFARACSQCHGLARAINSPAASRDFWEHYVDGMRRRSAFTPGPPITAEEGRAVADFLEFDARYRKIERKAEFDAQTLGLKRRYAQLIGEPAK